MIDRRVTVIAGDVGTDGLGLDDDRPRRPRRLRHRHPLRGHGRLRLAARRGRRGQPARADAASRRRCTTSASRPHLVAVSTCYVAGNRRGRAPEQLVDESPFFVDVDWRKERRRRAPSTRAMPKPTAGRPKSSPHSASEARARARCAPAARCSPTKTEQLRNAWVTDRMVDAGRARAASLGWPDAYAYTKALGERRSDRVARRRAGQHRAALDHRVRARRATAGLDPRLPHGRAGHHLLRARAAEGVPGRARGRRRRHPRRPRRRRRSCAVGRGASADAESACRSRRARATRCATAASSTSCTDGSANTRSTTPRVSRSSSRNGRFPVAGRVQGQLTRAKNIARTRRTRAASRCRCAASRQSRNATLEEQREEAERALAYVELYGAYAECEAIYGVDRLLELWDTLAPRRPATTFCFDPPCIDWDDYVSKIHLPSVVEHARVRTTPGGRAARTARTGCGARCCHPNGTWRRSISRTR